MQDSYIQAHNAESKAVWDAFNCGDATRHFQWLKDDLGLNDFETGFPWITAGSGASWGRKITIIHETARAWRSCHD